LQLRLFSLGYIADFKVLNSLDFYLPQHRPRVYIVAMAKRQFKCEEHHLEAALKLIFSTVEMFKSDDEMIPLAAFMKSDDDAIVVNERVRRTEAKMKELEDLNDRREKEVLWNNQHAEFLATKGITPAEAYAPLAIRQSPWYATLGAREQVCLGYAMKFMKEASVADISQSLNRITIGTHDTSPTCTPGGNLWFLSRPSEDGEIRPFIGTEMLAMQGYPVEEFTAELEKIGQTDQADLAGNAFSSTVYLAVLMAVLSVVPVATADPEDDIEALAILEDLSSLL